MPPCCMTCRLIFSDRCHNSLTVSTPSNLISCCSVLLSSLPSLPPPLAKPFHHQVVVLSVVKAVSSLLQMPYFHSLDSFQFLAAFSRKLD